MGNLSCVSCKTREDKQNGGCRPIARTHDVINNRVQTETENARLADDMDHETKQLNSSKRRTRVDPLLTSWVQNADKTMTEEEVAANAIVQMTLFIATQVMYPAIERYLDETVARELELLNADR